MRRQDSAFGAAMRLALILAIPALAAAQAARANPPSDASAASVQPPAASVTETRAAVLEAGDRVARWRAFTTEASRRFGIPLAWIVNVMRAESGGRTTLNGRPITSHAGAMGLMQLMPRTWAAMRARHGLGRDPHDPRDNILAGTAYLAELYERFGHPGLFGAYNAGPARYAAWLEGRRALPAETRDYLAQLTRKAAPGAPSPAVTAAAAPAGPAPLAAPAQPSRGQLFAVDRGLRAPLASSPASSAESLFVPLSREDESRPGD